LGEISPKLSPDVCTAALLKGNYDKNRDEDIYPGIFTLSTTNVDKNLSFLAVSQKNVWLFSTIFSS
jgi:hypothetical protein